MKQVLNGKLYDTESDSTERIAAYNPVTDTQDFSFLYETLYRTGKGNYFLHGRGGPKTRYAVSTGNGTSGSEEIKPLSEEEALEWCEHRQIDGEIIAEEFDDLIEDA